MFKISINENKFLKLEKFLKHVFFIRKMKYFFVRKNITKIVLNYFLQFSYKLENRKLKNR